MRAVADYFSVFENESFICVPNGAYTLSDDYFCRVFKFFVQLFAKLGVCTIIKRGKRIVENEYFGFSRNCSRNGKPLLLPARNVTPELSDFVFFLFGKFIDELFRLRNIFRNLEIFVGKAL